MALAVTASQLVLCFIKVVVEDAEGDTNNGDRRQVLSRTWKVESSPGTQRVGKRESEMFWAEGTA